MGTLTLTLKVMALRWAKVRGGIGDEERGEDEEGI